MKRSARITDILKPLSQAPTQAYISNALQVADILEWLLSQSPNHLKPNASGLKPTVCQTTFSISEEFLRRIYNIKKANPARFIVIIDRKALQKTIDLWKFISQVYDEVWIADNHSKILLIDYQDGRHAAMVTSQNLTRGNRAESSVISSADEIYYPLLADFNDLRKNNSAPMHDILPSTPSPLHSPLSTPNSQLSEIEQMAAMFVPITDIAIVLDMNPADLRDMIADPDNPVSKAYHRGKVKAKISIRGKEMEFAQVGSPLGIMSVRENLVSMEADE